MTSQTMTSQSGQMSWSKACANKTPRNSSLSKSQTPVFISQGRWRMSTGLC